ncbi:hypothetical protein ACOI1C_22260 [Bacillus sp. DJP31]|uniref:hypothetical protein n=1 Tax=Bacillus sp. DJP31 TaxID=3409789 RepID=UPI003BB7E3D4
MKRNTQIFLLLITVFILISCTQQGNPTPMDVLKSNPKADIFLFEGLVYRNASDLDWVTERDISKGKLVGEIQRVSTKKFKNGTATKLPVGAKIYLSIESSEDILIVEYKDKEILYLGLYEG